MNRNEDSIGKLYLISVPVKEPNEKTDHGPGGKIHAILQDRVIRNSTSQREHGPGGNDEPIGGLACFRDIVDGRPCALQYYQLRPVTRLRSERRDGRRTNSGLGQVVMVPAALGAPGPFFAALLDRRMFTSDGRLVAGFCDMVDELSLGGARSWQV